MRVVMYLRISNEDADLRETEKTESDSISHQRWLLTDFVKNHPDLRDAELDELCDDGWSGKNFERPGMTELLAQVKQGRVQCIVVKDFSRFGRDYLTVGNYISRVFPFMGVRFISVNDNFDSVRSEDIDSLDTSFKTLIYDLYSRELSKKVRSAMKRRAEQGLFVSPFAPYGYVKSSEDKHQLTIDKPAADVVRRIFRLALDGNGLVKICRMLNDDGVTTPMRYKWEAGVNRKWNYIHEDNFWMPDTVGRVLRDERYTGTLIFGKKAVAEIGGRTYKTVDRSSWVKCENAHEAIVSREIFDAVQQQLAKRATNASGPKTRSALSGKVVCGVCGHCMRREPSTSTIYYRCTTHYVTDRYSCIGQGVAEADILDTIREAVRYYARLAVRLDKVNAVRKEHQKQGKKDCGKKLIALQNEKARLDSRLQELYEGLVSGELSKETYLAQKSSIAQREQEIAAETATLEQSMAESNAGQVEAITKYIGYAEFDELTVEMLDELVKRVTVYPDDVLEVQLNFVDELGKFEKENAENETGDEISDMFSYTA